jgi:hypothetical protein
MALKGAVNIETGEVVLTVDQADLDQLVQLLRNSQPTVVEVARSPQRSATRPITRLEVVIGSNDAVLISSVGDTATFSGSASGLASLANEIAEFSEYNDLNRPGMHSHFDPAVEHGVRHGELDPNSVPLVITGPVPDEPNPE